MVSVNNGKEDVYTNFKAFNPKYDESYEIMADGDNAIIIKKLRLNGKTYTAKFASEDGKTAKYGAYQGEVLHQINSYDLSPQN